MICFIADRTRYKISPWEKTLGNRDNFLFPERFYGKNHPEIFHYYWERQRSCLSTVSGGGRFKTCPDTGGIGFRLLVIIDEPLAKCSRRRKQAMTQAGKPGPPGIFKQPGKICKLSMRFARGSDMMGQEAWSSWRSARRTTSGRGWASLLIMMN